MEHNKGYARDGRLMDQKPENITRLYSPHIIPMPSLPKHIFVRVVSRVLKPRIICLQFPQVALPLSGKEYLVGVVPPSVEAFRK